jgi:hypothetical protein
MQQQNCTPGDRLITARNTFFRYAVLALTASFVKADRVAHMISVLVDHDPDAASLNGPATYYDLGDSYCTSPFWSSGQHRTACTGCDFNLLKDSARGLILESKVSVRRAILKKYRSHLMKKP